MNCTINEEDAKRSLLKETISEPNNQEIDYFKSDKYEEDLIRFRKEHRRINQENEKLQEEKIRLEADIAFWKPLACTLLSILFGSLGALVGAFIMKKYGFL